MVGKVLSLICMSVCLIGPVCASMSDVDRCITSIIVHIFVVWYVVAERVCIVCSVIVHIDLSSSFLKNKVKANTTKYQSCFMYVLCQSVKNKIKLF